MTKSVEISVHILFWILYSSIRILSHGEIEGDYAFAIKFTIIALPFQIFFAYAHTSFLMPKFLLRKKYFKYILSTLLALFFASLLQRSVIYTGLGYWIANSGFLPGNFFQFKIFIYAIQTFTPAFIIAGFSLVKRYYKSENKLKEFESEKLKVELGFLRSQINPHFFLNTLNNIYGLALEKSNKTAEVIMRLSELMRYVLYEADSQLVPLEKELQSVKNLIELEQIRYDFPIDINFQITGDVKTYEIPPVIIIPLVENAFKHGIKYPSKNNQIDIKVSTFDNKIEIDVSNSIHDKNPPNENHCGIGLKNVKKRLEIVYGIHHELSIKGDNDKFKVKLAIENIAIY